MQHIKWLREYPAKTFRKLIDEERLKVGHIKNTTSALPATFARTSFFSRTHLRTEAWMGSRSVFIPPTKKYS